MSKRITCLRNRAGLTSPIILNDDGWVAETADRFPLNLDGRIGSITVTDVAQSIGA